MGPIGLQESIANLLPLFETNPALVLLQECNLSMTSVERLRQITHRLLPHYCLFVSKPPRLEKGRGKIHVATLVHVSLAARATLLDVKQKSFDVLRDDLEILSRVHFIRLIDPRSGVSLLLANVYQYQADQATRQAALLKLIHDVVQRWRSQSDHVIVGGDFNASIQPRFGYSEASVTCQADLGLQAWAAQTDLTFAPTNSPTWFSRDESHQAVLDGFFSSDRTGGVSVKNVVVNFSPDPRHDHRFVRVVIAADQIAAMLPLESLRKPKRLKMHLWAKKRDQWAHEVEEAVSQLAPSTEDGGSFEYLDHLKQIAMSKAKAILGESSQKIRCQIPYHSSEFKKLKARLGLLKLVRTEVNNRRLQGGQPFPPSRAMRKAWDSGLYPESDAPGTVEKMGLPKFTMLSDLWSAENCHWALEWLRYLSQQIARTEEEIRLLRQREIQQSAEKRRKDAIERMSAGGELRHLLHPPSCLPHSPALRTNFPDSLHVSGSLADIEALILRLLVCDRT